jgi:hypothetical protein
MTRRSAGGSFVIRIVLCEGFVLRRIRILQLDFLSALLRVPADGAAGQQSCLRAPADGAAGQR